MSDSNNSDDANVRDSEGFILKLAYFVYIFEN